MGASMLEDLCASCARCCVTPFAPGHIVTCSAKTSQTSLQCIRTWCCHGVVHTFNIILWQPMVTQELEWYVCQTLWVTHWSVRFTSFWSSRDCPVGVRSSPFEHWSGPSGVCARCKDDGGTLCELADAPLRSVADFEVWMVLSSVSVRADADWQMNASEGRFDDSLGDESTMFARVFEVFESAWRPFLELFCLKAERKASPSFVSSARGCCAPFFSRCKSRSVNPSQLVIRHTCLHSRFSSVNESTDVCISQSSMLEPHYQPIRSVDRV